MSVDVGRIGIWSAALTWSADPGESADAAAELEGLGYQALWLGGSPSPTLQQPEQALAATTAIAVATGIVSVWAAPAATVAAAYQQVVSAHPGRFLLGLGISHAPLVEPTGQAYAQPYRTMVGFLDGLDAADPPVPPAGRALAALGPRMLGLAAERAAGAHPYLVTPEHTVQARGVLGAGPLLAPEQKVVLDSDPGRAREIARTALDRYLRMENYTRNLLRLGFSEEDITGVSNHLVDALVAWGDEEAIRQRVADHHAAGADHVCIQVLTDQPGLPLEQWRALAPALT